MFLKLFQLLALGEEDNNKSLIDFSINFLFMLFLFGEAANYRL